MNNQSEELEENDNNEDDIPDEDLFISSVFNAIQITSNYMTPNNVSSKANFKKIKKNSMIFIPNTN